MDIAICIPYFERRAALHKTIQSFIDMGYFNGHPRTVELCICDDGSIDEPIEDGDTLGVPVKLIALPQKKEWKTPCVPLNAAIRATTAPIIVIQSPETYHETPVIFNMADKIEHYKDVVNSPCRKPGAKWKAHPQFHRSFLWWCQMFSRMFFEEIGGFNEEYREYSGGEDNDIEFRMTLAGCAWKWADTDQLVIHGTETPKTNRTKRLGKHKLHKEYDWKTIGDIRSSQRRR